MVVRGRGEFRQKLTDHVVFFRQPSGELGSFPPPTITAGCQPPWICFGAAPVAKMQQNGSDRDVPHLGSRAWGEA